MYLFMSSMSIVHVYMDVYYMGGMESTRTMGILCRLLERQNEGITLCIRYDHMSFLKLALSQSMCGVLIDQTDKQYVFQ